MPERDPIDVIREQLNRLDGMADLNPDHDLFKHWHTETKTILEKAFSSKSLHYQNFVALRFREMSVKAFASPEIDRLNAARHRKDLENVKSILQTAIKELTLDRTLFKKIQTTPEMVEVPFRGEYFVSPGVSPGTSEPEMIQAIESAFEGSGLSPIHAGESHPKGEFLRYRMDQIRRARFGIYNLSDATQTEAFLDLGIALGMGKEVTVICKKGSLLPNGVKQLTRIEYENSSDLTEKLRKKMA